MLRQIAISPGPLRVSGQGGARRATHFQVAKPRPELDIDLYHGHPNPKTRIWDGRSGPVVDGSGPMQDLPLGV